MSTDADCRRSPHLVEVRERICVNGEPLTYERFAQCLDVVFNALEATRVRARCCAPPHLLLLLLHLRLPPVCHSCECSEASTSDASLCSHLRTAIEMSEVDILSSSRNQSNPASLFCLQSKDAPMPAYFAFLTLLAFYIYVREKVCARHTRTHEESARFHIVHTFILYIF